MIDFRQRLLATVVLLLVAAAYVAAVSVATWNPWRYLVLDSAGGAGAVTAVIGLVLALLALIAWLWGLRIDSSVATGLGLVMGFALLCGLACVNAFADWNHHVDGPPVRLALSADGRYEAVELAISSDTDSDYVGKEIRLRSRAGLLSREPAAPLAELWIKVPVRPEDPPVPAITATRFSGPHEIQFTGTDGLVRTIRFDPRTLMPDRTLTRCGPHLSLCMTVR